MRVYSNDGFKIDSNRLRVPPCQPTISSSPKVVFHLLEQIPDFGPLLIPRKQNGAVRFDLVILLPAATFCTPCLIIDKLLIKLNNARRPLHYMAIGMIEASLRVDMRRRGRPSCVWLSSIRCPIILSF